MATQCDLCEAQEELKNFEVPYAPNNEKIELCKKCLEEVAKESDLDTHHWRALGTTMWSEKPQVTAMAYRMLHKLNTEDWAQDLLSQIYLDDETLAWAKLGVSSPSDEGQKKTVDSNGTELLEGDSVTLIKDLEVKGAGFTAKRGTIVKGIRLTDDPKFIEGKINGSMIVLVAAFLKKVV